MEKSLISGVYLPWFWAIGCALLVIVSRILTNRSIYNSRFPMPRWVSTIYLIGFLGLIVTFFWSIISIAWWAFLPVVALYAVTEFIPSALKKLTNDPNFAHLAAIQQATEELDYMEPGSEKMEMVMERADEIMRSEGWTPK